ncbi:MAG TPA: hypothetical protein VMG63_23410 [Terriglobia bacterium]|nr:hypothetical protein [Terriglobia bacterium]
MLIWFPAVLRFSAGLLQAPELLQPALRAVVDLLFHFRRHIRSDTVAGEFSEGCSGGGNNAIRHATAGNLWIELARTDAGIAMRARDGGYGAKEVRYGLVLPAVGQIHCTQPK